MVSKNRPTKTLVYVRVSTKKQAKNFSLATQERDCREYAQRHRIDHVVKVLTDVGSGLTMKRRPGLRELCDLALDSSNGITDIIFWELDRFTRRVRHFVNLTEDMVEAGITLHLASEEEQYNHQNSQAWVLKALGAQGESAKISKRTKGGQTAAIEEGRNIGSAPWGYLIWHKPGEEEIAGWLIPDPENWDYCLILWGLAGQGRTPQQIANYLNQEGVKGPAGEPWTADAVRYILRNRKYTGVQIRGQKRESRLPGPPDETPPTIFEDAHEAAVSVEDFERIQEMIAERHMGQAPPRCHSSPSPLSGITKCGICKTSQKMNNLVLTRSKGKAKLRCSLKKKLGVAYCNSTNVPLDLLMDRFMDRFMNVFLMEDTQQAVLAKVAKNATSYLNKQDSRKTNLQGRLRELNKEIKNIKDVVKQEGTKRAAVGSLMEDLDRYERERWDIEREINGINDDDAEVRQYVTDPEGVIEKLLDQKTYAASRDPQIVRDLIELYVDRIEVYEGHGVVYYKLGTRRAGQPATETIYLNGAHQAECHSHEAPEPSDHESCPLDGSMGMCTGAAELVLNRKSGVPGLEHLALERFKGG